MLRQRPSDKEDRPGLDRPSLFAGMEDDGVTFVGDMQPVQILSTLESTRKPTRKGRGPLEVIQGFTKRHSHWQTRGLLVLMSVGVISLLAGFVMVVKEGRSGNIVKAEPLPSTNIKRAQTSPSAQLAKPIADSNPLAALMATSASSPKSAPPPALAPQPTAAVIENMSTAATPVPVKPAVTTATPVTQLAMAAPHVPAKTTAAPAAKTATKSQVESQEPVKRAAPAPRRRDEDVALLEAMFAHTRPRPNPVSPPVSVADDIRQQCGSLNGPAAATCRARICVQNPTAPVCHPE